MLGAIWQGRYTIGRARGDGEGQELIIYNLTEGLVNLTIHLSYLFPDFEKG